LQITATLTKSGETTTFATDDVSPMSVRKVKFKIPATTTLSSGANELRIEVKDRKGVLLDQQTINIEVRQPSVHHERTFISAIDGSVQYYSVAPAIGGSVGKGLVLSVHGASVEARNQARAYKMKDDLTVVAATNRRPFGFNWEEWGRIDALEVLAQAKKIFKTDPARTYLTGHSMGGHGTWFLGTTYPDRFAAIAPCASYPDIITYGSGRGDLNNRESAIFEPIARAANGGRVLSMIENLKQSGVYVLHGDKDTTVPIEQVRKMRKFWAIFIPIFVITNILVASIGMATSRWIGNRFLSFLRVKLFRPTSRSRSSISAPHRPLFRLRIIGSRSNSRSKRMIFHALRPLSMAIQ
ncbi:MAG: alpha/beta hydrolase-fold protein, partial [Mucinivorans sp.]